MLNSEKLVVSHAPFWHDGSGVPARNLHIILAAMPAVLYGLFQFGPRAVAVVTLCVSLSVIWELIFNKISKRPVTVADYHAMGIGLFFAMLLPATVPWWVVLIGTFLAVVLGKQIFGGIGANPFNPSVLAFAIITISWPHYVDFDTALANYDFSYLAAYPLGQLKHFGTEAVAGYSLLDLLMGRQTGGIGTTFGAGLILGGIYLMARGIVRWEIPLAFLVSVAVTAFIFHMADPLRFAGPTIHLLAGFTLIGAFFLATEDSSSPVNFYAMLLYGALAGLMTVLIRNIGAYVDGVIYAILVANLVSPLLDKIRPKAIGKVV